MEDIRVAFGLYMLAALAASFFLAEYLALYLCSHLEINDWIAVVAIMLVSALTLTEAIWMVLVILGFIFGLAGLYLYLWLFSGPADKK